MGSFGRVGIRGCGCCDLGADGGGEGGRGMLKKMTEVAVS